MVCNVVMKKQKTKKTMTLVAIAMLSGFVLSTATQIGSPVIKAATMDKSKQAKYEVKVNDESLQKAVQAAKAAGVKVTQKATIPKEVSKSEQDSTVKSIEADYAAQTKGLNGTTEQQKKNNANYDSEKAQYDKDKKQYDSDLEQYNKKMAQYNKDKASNDKMTADYNAKMAQYQKDLKEYEYELSHPSIITNETDWSSSQIAKLISGLTGLTKISGSKSMTTQVAGGSKVSASVASNVLKHTYGGESTKNYIMMQLKKGDAIKYSNAFKDQSSGNQLDVVLKIDSFSQPAGSATPYIQFMTKQIGTTAIVDDNGLVTYTMTFYKHGTNTQVSLPAGLFGIGDIDDGQSLTFTTAAKGSLIGSKLKVSGKKVSSTLKDSADDNDSRYQAWYTLTDKKSINFTFGNDQKKNSIEGNTSNLLYAKIHFAIGNEAFAAKIPTKPQEPAKPNLKPLVKPKKPVAPKAPVKKVESATFYLYKLTINEIKQFNAKFIERT